MKGKVWRVVADSNVLVKWFIPEDYSEYAVVLRDDHLYGRVDVIAPVYAVLEFTNCMRKYVVRGLLKKDYAIKALNYLREANIIFEDITYDLAKKSLEYAIEKHITVYDSYYIMLARKYDTVMYTADEKLLSKLQGKEQCVKHVKEYIENRKVKLK